MFYPYCAEARLRMVLLQVALELHKIRYDRYPGSLEDLTPGILETVPTDPYSEKPFQYEFDGEDYKLVCIGPDLRYGGAEMSVEDDWIRRPTPEYVVDYVILSSRTD